MVKHVQSDEVQSRRRFLKDVGRAVVATGVVAATVALTLRESENEEKRKDPLADCVNRYDCHRCGQLRQCQLPQGESARSQGGAS